MSDEVPGVDMFWLRSSTRDFLPVDSHRDEANTSGSHKKIACIKNSLNIQEYLRRT